MDLDDSDIEPEGIFSGCGNRTKYAYDGLGRRIEKEIDGTVTRYIYDAEDVFLEYDYNAVLLTNTLTARYGHGDRIDQPLTSHRIASNEEYFYHADHLGSIRALTDDMGDVVNEYVYDGYGRLHSVTEAVIQPFSYTGREHDPESGLYYYRVRSYDPVSGRFLSQDPIDYMAGDVNLFRYVRNNPANWIDPYGLARGDRWDPRTYLPDYDRARRIGEEVRRTETGHNDASDARRHSEWNRRMYEEIGPFTAWSAGLAYELEGTCRRGQPIDEFMMDLHNNREGRDAAREGRAVDPKRLRIRPGAEPGYDPY